MDTHEFREVGHRMVDLFSEYLEHIEERPLFADVEPAKLNKLFAEPLPQNPSSSDEVLQQIQEKLLPYCTHVGHPGYFGLITPSPKAKGTPISRKLTLCTQELTCERAGAACGKDLEGSAPGRAAICVRRAPCGGLRKASKP